MPNIPVKSKSTLFSGPDILFTDKAVFTRGMIPSSSPRRRYPVTPDISTTSVACTDVAEPMLCGFSSWW